MSGPILFIVSSPSGAGKTTLCRGLIDTTERLGFSVSHTTRPPRAGETDGSDYHFVSPEAFDRMIAGGEFLEWARVHGNHYGTARSEVASASASGVDLLCDVDYQGARQIKERYPDAVGIFILPPSVEELRRRLEQRGTDSPEQRKIRFQNARVELEQFGSFDYLVTNDDLQTALDNLRSIVKAERCRRVRQPALAERLLKEFVKLR